MALRYRPYMPRRAVQQQGSDAERGMQIGSQIGKGLGGLAEAIKGAQDSAKQDAIANQLMNAGPTGQDPRVQDLGKMPGGDGSSQDLGTMPAQQTFTNPSTGNVEPLQGQDDTMTMPASSGSGPTAGSLANAPTSTGDDMTLPTSDGLGPTVGSLIHSGGLQELKMRQAFQEQNLNSAIKQAQLAKANQGPDALSVALDQAKLADYQAKAAGTGGYAKPKAAAKTGDDEPVSIGTEPVTSQKQLVKHFDGTYGNGTFSDVMSNIDQATVDPNNPNVVLAGDPNKPIRIPMADAQIYTRQMNALRLKQGLPAFRVPGEDQSVGAAADNPFIAKSNLDVYSRAPGTWIKLPNGKIAQVPGRGVMK